MIHSAALEERGMASKDGVPRVEAEAALSAQLRGMFDLIAEQPVPAKLVDLVDALEEKRRHQEGVEEEA
jgi:hypothetical protein